MKDVDIVRKSAKEANDEIALLRTKVDALTSSLESVTEENEQLKKTCANNLKYLVNHDRNARRPNVMVLGLSEDEDLTIGDVTVKEDKQKIEKLLNFIGIKEGDVEIVSFNRLGNSESEGIRPIKMILKNSEMAGLVVSKASRLKNLNKKIFLKHDKSLKEREEFQRLLKKKDLLKTAHPTEEGQEARVALEKGILKVDGVEVDRYQSPQTIF